MLMKYFTLEGNPGVNYSMGNILDENPLGKWKNIVGRLTG